MSFLLNIQRCNDTLNYQVQEEEKRSKLPANWEAKKRRVEWELSDQKAREEAEKGGKDYDIVKNMSTSISIRNFRILDNLQILH